MPTSHMSRHHGIQIVIRNASLKDWTPKQSGLLRAAAAGGIWTADRLHAAGFADTDACTACGEPASVSHRLWSCPQLERHEDERVSKTNWMKSRFSEELDWAQCMWDRAIGPCSLARFKHHFEPESPNVVASHNFKDGITHADAWGTVGIHGES